MSEFAGNRRLDTTQMTTIDKQLKDLVDAGAMILVPQILVPIGMGYARVIGKTVRWSVPFPPDQSGVHEFDFNDVEVNGPHITFETDDGNMYVSAVDEWFDEAGDFREVKSRWDNVLSDPKEKEGYLSLIHI